MTLPPYARKVKRARDIGQHPDEITIVYSTRWCARQYREGTVIVLREEYRRGEYDSFAWCAGIATVCLNHDCDEFEFAAFVADVAGWTAPVYAGPFKAWGKGLDQYTEADTLMHALRWREAEWPPGWDEPRDRAYAQRVARYDYVQTRRERGLRA